MANQLFEDVFNKSVVYQTLFFNIKPVLVYPTLEALEKENKPLFERWKYISESKYGAKISPANLSASVSFDMIYQDNAPYYPEYTKIVAITYATLYAENGNMKRSFKKIVSADEQIVLTNFIEVLHVLSSEGTKSSPNYFPALCGYNIISHEIPLLIKRFMVNRAQMDKKALPYILKRALSIKPWESGVMDVANVWKFNGYDNPTLMLICDFLGLKKTVDLLPLPELSQYYWNNIETKPEETLEFVALQSATQTNLVIQIMNELRQL